jgi:pyrroloquinoline quinone (PQQ) biosynthesis protein C
MSFEQRMKNALNSGIEQLNSTDFVNSIQSGDSTRDIYKEYLRYAFHYVRETSSFTPLAARRMDPKHLKVRKWLLEHSSEEMGHELMALRDLERLGEDKEEIKSSAIPVGVTSWTSFFHYKVSMANPFCAFGVLYFLEGMAQELAPKVLIPIIKNLPDSEKKAITFFKEHGELDQEHMKEQEALIFSMKLTAEEEDAMVQTVLEAAQIKIFMLNDLMKKIK